MKATVILLAAAWGLPAQTLEGRIVNASTGAGIPDATVRLRPLTQNQEGPDPIKTDGMGRFRIDGLAPGTYGAFYKARGYWTDPAVQDPGRQPRFQMPAKGEPVRVEWKLQPLPKIAGRVLDASGKTVPNANVWVLGDSVLCNGLPCYRVLKEVKTSDKGEYSVADIDDVQTRWLVAASAPASWDPPESPKGQRLGWAQTFYPGATDVQLAARIGATPGSEHWNLDIKLAPVPVQRLQGSVRDDAGNVVSNAAVTLYNPLGVQVTQQTNSDGSFAFDKTAEGEWRLWTAWERGGVKLWAAQSVQVKDRDPEDVELRLAAPFSLHGKIVFEAPEGVPAPADPPNVIFAYNAAGFGNDQTFPGWLIAHPDDKGDFTISLYAGLYRMEMIEAPAGAYYLQSILRGGVDALSAHAVPILSGAETVVVTYKYGGGSVTGTLEACGGVALVPVDPALRVQALVRVTRCGPNGQFSFQAVRPGEYYGSAISGEGPPEESVLRGQSRITVRDNEHTTAEIRPAGR